MNTDGPKTPPLPPELIVRPVATIFSRARSEQRLIAHLGHERGSPGSASVGRHADRAPLHPAVAAGHQLGERQRQQAEHQAAQRRLDVPGDRQRVEDAVAQAVEDPHVEPADAGAGQGQEGEQGQVAQAVEGRVGTMKIGLGVMNSAKVE